MTLPDAPALRPTDVTTRNPPPPTFIADQDHPGTSEAAWAASGRLAGVADLDLPDFERVVVVAPHPDDEVLGAGGLIQMASAAGAMVEVCAVTDGTAFLGPAGTAQAERLAGVRTRESEVALGHLGLAPERRHRLGLPDGEVGGHEAEVASALRGRLDRHTLCVAPWRHDGHPDHDATGRAAAIATAATGATLYEYLVWAWHWAEPESDDLPWARCRRLGFDGRVAGAKRRAVTTFTSQIRPSPDGAEPVLPPAVLRRFRRPFEIFVR